MRGLWKYRLSLSLGLIAAPAWADDIQWRTAAPRTAVPAIRVEPAIPAITVAPVEARPRIAATTAPEPRRLSIAAGPELASAPSPLVPVSLSVPTINVPPSVVRGQGADAQRMPEGPPKPIAASNTKKVADPPTAVPEQINHMPKAAGTPSAAGPTVPAPSHTANAPLAPVPAPPKPLAPDCPPGAGPALGSPECPEGTCAPTEGPVHGDGEVIEGGDGEVVEGEEVVGPGWFGRLGMGRRPFHLGLFENCTLFQGDWFHLGEGQGNLYFNAESLTWWLDSPNLPPLVTRSFGIQRATSGRIGDPSTTVALGGNSLDDSAQSGGRFTLGYWVPGRNLAIEGTYLFFGSRTANFATGPLPGFSIYRPFTNGLNGAPAARPVNVPGSFAGGVSAQVSTQLDGFEVNLLSNISSHPGCQLDFLAGVRHLSLEDSLMMSETRRNFDGTARFTRTLVTDSFTTDNAFLGGQVGLNARFTRGCWNFDVRPRVAIGYTDQEVTIAGSTLGRNAGVNAANRPGGFLALPTNIGQYSVNRFAVVPELGLTVGYQVTDWFRLYAGYTFLYWSSVARPGNQIDTVINPTQVPSNNLGRPRGAPRPTFAFQDTSFFAHGLNFGMELRY